MVSKARPPSAPPTIGPKEIPALDEATEDVVPEGAVVGGDTAWGLEVDEGTLDDDVEFDTSGVISI